MALYGVKRQVPDYDKKGVLGGWVSVGGFRGVGRGVGIVTTPTSGSASLYHMVLCGAMGEQGPYNLLYGLRGEVAVGGATLGPPGPVLLIVGDPRDHIGLW